MDDKEYLSGNGSRPSLQPHYKRWTQLCYAKRKGILFISVWQLLLGLEAVALNISLLLLGRGHLGGYPLTNGAGICSGGWVLIIGALGISVWRKINRHQKYSDTPIRSIRITYIVQAIFNLINLIVSVQLIVYSVSITLGCANKDSKADWCGENWNGILVCGILGILVGAVNWILCIPSIIIFAIMEKRYRNGHGEPLDKQSIVTEQ